MITQLKAAAAALAIAAVAAPAMAQMPPPPGMRAEGHGGGPREMPFKGMSEPGRRTVMAAMRPDGPADRADHDRVRMARDRMLQVLGADRLDPVALRRAMDDERDAANAMKARRQGALLQALQGLSLADRRAFVDDARAMRGRFEGRMKMFKRGMHGRGMDDMPPPPPM